MDFSTSPSFYVSLNMIQVGKGVLPNSLISGSSVLPNSHFLTFMLVREMDLKYSQKE